MKKVLFFLFATVITVHAFSQAEKIITRSEVERVERVLAADDMRGRKTFTPDIDRAAAFIAEEFKKAGLQTFNGANSYLQEFVTVRPKFISASASLDGNAVSQKAVIVFTSQPSLKVDEKSGYEKVFIRAGANFLAEARKLARGNKNVVVLVDSSFSSSFGTLTRMKSFLFKSPYSAIFILSGTNPSSYSIEATHEITESKLSNVVGVLPGNSKKDEIVVFSGHYDHLGVGTAQNGDSIYNGANDDAAGTTGVIMLAKYYASMKNNERTIIFAAFTAEEVGGYGSQYFSKQLDPAQVVAMFNIEMIGTESQWGKNSAYITGYDKTNMGELMANDLSGSGFTFYPDPYPQQQLFYRSDNATLARLGVPAHTISTSKMDSEPNYHKLTDHVETLDLDNMTMIIRAIALSAKSIIAGTATPSRVKVEDLR